MKKQACFLFHIPPNYYHVSPIPYLSFSHLQARHNEVHSFFWWEDFEETITSQKDKPGRTTGVSFYTKLWRQVDSILLNGWPEIHHILLSCRFGSDLPVIVCELAAFDIWHRDDPKPFVLSIPNGARYLQDTQDTPFPKKWGEGYCQYITRAVRLQLFEKTQFWNSR